MARIHYWQYIVDDQGRPLQDVNIRFYLSDNPTQEADIFTHHALGAPTTTSDANIITDGNGFFELWFGDEFENIGGYVSTQKFKLEWNRAGIQIGAISNIDVYPPVFKVDETDNTSSIKADKNRTISNELAYKWNSHVDVGIAGEPHDFQPVDTTDENWRDADTTYNKLVSNYLMNYLEAAVASAGEVAVKTVFSIDSGSWSVSGDGTFYYDLSHSFGRQYPIVQLTERLSNPKLDNFRFEPTNVRSLDLNTIRISVSAAIDVVATIIG